MKSIYSLILFMSLFIVVSLFSCLYIVEKSNSFKPLPENKNFYGYDGRLYTHQGELVAIHEPIMNRIRPATLSDKFFYGEIK